jgi:hypothetical protein
MGFPYQGNNIPSDDRLLPMLGQTEEKTGEVIQLHIVPEVL